MDFVKSHTGEKWFTIIVGLIIAIMGLVFFIFITRNKSNRIKTFVLAAVLLAGLIFAYQFKNPAEKIHILEFGILGWFAGRDLIKKKNIFKGIIASCLFSFFIGFLDESFQKTLPYRTYDVRDILFDGLGGLWGVGLYLLK